MPIQCPACRTINADKAKYCNSCGSGLAVHARSSMSAAVVSKPTTLPGGSIRPPATSVSDADTDLKPPRVWRGKRGIVTNVREEYLQTQTTGSRSCWVFDLRLTDKDWRPCKSRSGFLKPVVKVMFETNKVHGAPLEEGCRVMVQGRNWRGSIKAKRVWNLTLGGTIAVLGGTEVFWGRVTDLATKQSPDMRYGGQRYLEVWSFCLQRTDRHFRQLHRNARGDPVMALPVEIRAQMIGGPLREGHKVEVHGRQKNGILYTKELYNHSAGGAGLVVKGWTGAP